MYIDISVCKCKDKYLLIYINIDLGICLRGYI